MAARGVARRRDVEKRELVDLLLVEDAHRVDRVADVVGLLEAHGLDEALAVQQDRESRGGGASSDALQEVPQQGQAERVALLGVATGSPDVVALDARREHDTRTCAQHITSAASSQPR